MELKGRAKTPASTPNLAATPASPAGDVSERFLRGQRRGARTRTRRLGRGLLRLVAGAAFASGLSVLVLWGVSAVSRSPELTVDRVRVEGNVRLSDGEILELLELSPGSNILTLDLDEVREKLLRSAWIRDVALERVLPATLTLSIVEREPVAVVVMRELFLLAADGTVLDEVSPFSDITALPLVRGLIEPEAGRAAEETLQLAGRLAAELERDPRLAALVSEIDVTGGERSITLRLRSPGIALMVDERSMMDRLEESVPLLDGIVERFPALAVVDLRFAGRVYLRNAETSAQRETETGAGTETGNDGVMELRVQTETETETETKHETETETETVRAGDGGASF